MADCSVGAEKIQNEPEVASCRQEVNANDKKINKYKWKQVKRTQGTTAGCSQWPNGNNLTNKINHNSILL